MRLLIAGIVGGFVGFVQLFTIWMIEYTNESGRSGALSSDAVFPWFAALVMVEIMCVMALSMYRISPWIARLLGDSFEADRITEGRKRYGLILQRTTITAISLRRIIVGFDAGEFSWALSGSWAVALAPLLIPRPKA